MSINLRIFLIVITIIYYMAIIKSIRQKKLEISLAIFWIFSGILLIIISIFPNLCIEASKYLGFEKTSNMIFCIAIFIAFYLIFKLSLRLSDAEKKNTMLIQEISILKSELKDKNEE